MLDRYCCVLRVGHQLPSGPCVTTKLFEDCEWFGTCRYANEPLRVLGKV